MSMQICFSTKEIGTVRGLVGDIALYGLNGRATVEVTLDLIRRVSVTPITRGEGYILAFTCDEYDLLAKYVGETLHQGDYTPCEGLKLMALAERLGLPEWVYPPIKT